MRVCMIVECHVRLHMGGAEYQAHLLAEELSRRDCVQVTYLGRHVPPSGDLSYATREIGNAAGFRGRAVFFDARSLWDTLVELQPDVIYQRIKQSYTAVCGLYARRRHVPLVFHSSSEADVGSRRLWKPLSTNGAFDLLESVAGNWGVRHASHVVVQTEQQRELLRQRHCREPSAVVRNFQPLPSALPEKGSGPTRVLWVGNLKDVKRPHLFLELAALFANRDDLEFWMVGRPSTNFSFRSTMSDIQRSPHVRYFGELPLDEVNDLMNEADVFVNTSEFEGSPNTFIQAWARGAVVTSLVVDIDGGLEAMGIGYRTESVQRLAQAIDQLARSPALRREIANRAFAYVHREHSLDNAAKLADLVLDAAKSWQRPPA